MICPRRILAEPDQRGHIKHLLTRLHEFNDPVGMDISGRFESAHNIPKHVLLGPAAIL